MPTALEYEWNNPVLGFCNQVGPHGCQRGHQADSRLCSDPRFLRPGLCKVGFAHSYPLRGHFWAVLREWQVGSLPEVTWLPHAVMWQLLPCPVSLLCPRHRAGWGANRASFFTHHLLPIGEISLQIKIATAVNFLFMAPCEGSEKPGMNPRLPWFQSLTSSSHPTFPISRD